MGSLVAAALSMAAAPAASIACELFACASAGGAAACTLRTDTGTSVTTCAAWSALPDACDVFCTAVCRIDDPPCASDGRAFCNDCLLSSTLCREEFSATGPVAGAVCSLGTSPRLPRPPRETSTPPPVRDDDDAVVPTPSPSPVPAIVGEACASPVLLSAKLCADGLVCVLDDLGFLAADTPDSGTCVAASDAVPVGPCAEDLCATAGATAVCEFNGRIATCSAFELGEDDGSRPGGEGDICCLGGNCGINPPPQCGLPLICVSDPIPTEETTMPTGPDGKDDEVTAAETAPVEQDTDEAEQSDEASPTEAMATEAEVVSPQFGTCGYNCRTREVFRPAKADYCCRVRGLGCPPSPSPSPSPLPSPPQRVPRASPTLPPLNCFTKEVWSPTKVARCCVEKKIGCPPSLILSPPPTASVAPTSRARSQPTVTVTPTVTAAAATPSAAPTVAEADVFPSATHCN